MSKHSKSDIEQFIALPESQKRQILRGIEAQTPQQHLARSRPLRAADRRRWRRFKAKMGRPQIGKGAKTISLTVERQLLAQADAYAKQHRISRAKLIAEGLRAILGAAA